jgi:phosphatidylglycerophosphatase A
MSGVTRSSRISKASTISTDKRAAIPAGFLTRHPAHFIALGFGSGLVPVVPGTAGTLLAYPIFFLLFGALALWAQLVVAAVLFALGIWACTVTGRNLGVVDHGAVVWDEVAAMLLVLMVTPFGWAWYVAAFVIFRAMDILKPFPIRLADRNIKNGFGVMFDDLLAATYSIAILYVLERWMYG